MQVHYTDDPVFVVDNAMQERHITRNGGDVPIFQNFACMGNRPGVDLVIQGKGQKFDP